MNHEPSNCNGGYGCGGIDCACPCHFEEHTRLSSIEYEQLMDDATIALIENAKARKSWRKSP